MSKHFNIKIIERIYRGHSKTQIIDFLLLEGNSKEVAEELYDTATNELNKQEKSNLVSDVDQPNAVESLRDFFKVLLTDSEVTKKARENDLQKGKITSVEIWKETFADFLSLVNLFFSLGVSERQAVSFLEINRVPKSFIEGLVKIIYKDLSGRPKAIIEVERKHVLNTKLIIHDQIDANREELLERLILAGWSKSAAAFMLFWIETEIKNK